MKEELFNAVQENLEVCIGETVHRMTVLWEVKLELGGKPFELVNVVYQAGGSGTYSAMIQIFEDETFFTYDVLPRV